MSNFFESGAGRQNGVFGQGMPMFLESASKDAQQQQPPAGGTTDQPDDEKMMLEAVNRAADESDRSMAAAAVLEWARGGDTSYEAFDDMAMAMAGIGEDDDDADPSDEQIEEYNDYLELMAHAAVSFGASKNDVQAMIDDEDDDAADSVADALAGLNEDKDDEAITAFSLKSDLMMESVVKVIRNGEVKLIKKNVRKRRITPAQRTALKKARMKAHSSAARVARAKSMKQRKRRGM